MIKVESFRTDNSEFADKAFRIRNEVFVREQFVPHELEYDEHEHESQHYLLYINKEAIGTARWRITDKGIKLERFAVLKEYRNQGYGAYLLKRVLSDTLKFKLEIYLHSQVRAMSFYERYGFRKKGKMFIEAGIEHYYMNYFESM